jgi:hypothetical protein
VKPLVLAALCAGCAAVPPVISGGSLNLFADVSAPLDYRADLGEVAGREVRGEACQSGIFIPLLTATQPVRVYGEASIAWGEGGYRDALKQAQAQAPGATLTDVRADLHQLSILTVFRRDCLVVTASAR